MSRLLLTDRKIKAQKAPPAGRVELHDTLLTGLSLRITDRDIRTWSVLCRLQGQQIRVTLGRFPLIGLGKARKLARHALEQVAEGIDPRPEEAQRRAQESRRRPRTVKAVVEDFVQLYASERPKWGELTRFLRKDVVNAWGNRSIGDITKADAVELLAATKVRAPVLANRGLKILKTFFAWTVDNDIIGASPVATIKRPARETPRQRTLSHDEIRGLWLSCERLKWPWPEINRLLLLTAMRRDEIAGLWRREHNGAERVIELPPDRSKTGLPIVQPLSEPAVQILEEAPQIGKSGLFFPSKVDKPLVQFSIAKSALDREMLVELRKIAAERGEDPETIELKPWKVHDLRGRFGPSCRVSVFPQTSASECWAT
jgi:integrase